MGTRSMTYMIDEFDGKTPIISQYRQYDGYIKGGQGQDLCNFLLNRGVTNGFSQKSVLTSNGMDDMAAQYVCYLKSDPSNITGNVYLYPVRKLPTKKQTFEQYRDKYLIKYALDCGCEYIYIIRSVNGQLEIQVHHWTEGHLFTGTVQELVEKFDVNTENALTAETEELRIKRSAVAA